MSHPGVLHKSIGIADQSTTSEKAEQHVMLVRVFLIGIRTDLKISSYPGISSHRQRRSTMKIVVIGGTGLIGSKTVTILRPCGAKVGAASAPSGVHTLSGG